MCDPVGYWSRAGLMLENLPHPMNLPASVYCTEAGGKAKGAAQFPQLLVPRDHFSAPEAEPAGNLDPRALSAVWCGNPLERFPGGWTLGFISFNCFMSDLKRGHISP